MLEQLLIFTRGGLILWTCKELGNALKGSPIDTLIRSCLLEERSGEVSFNYESYTLKWTFHNDLGLVFVAVYQRILHLLYVDDLLSMVKESFSEIYDPKRMSYDDFDESLGSLGRKLRPVSKSGLDGGKKSGGSKKDDGDGNKDKVGSLMMTNGHSNGNHKMEDDADKTDLANGKENTADNVVLDPSKLMKLRSKGVRGRGGLRKTDSIGNKSSKVTAAEPPKKATKKNRVWDDAAPKQVKLDFTDSVDESGNGDHVDVVAADQGESMMDKEEANLERTDLEPALKALKERLMTKNVAEEIAEKLCESWKQVLKERSWHRSRGSPQPFRLLNCVDTYEHQGAMEDALIRILTPRRSIDIMRDVHAAKEQRRPYVVVFVGVNGVGKSTNLAKVAYWLQQHKVSVMMAACDTFRSGAVEQLRTHARSYSSSCKGSHTGSNPERIGCCLVDTAGRMQDNEPLMRALSKLINLNKPDLVLFVGEALVGNDAVDQLSKFNQKLSDLSNSGTTRLIDGILLTKFDTIDDKVGAALSMVYISGAPVMFVGVASLTLT
ncbi:signal recognition particle receptor alpha subunit family protein [Raphanus sativus]|nr:signal recognition particle receptor alpha subunit family protein [Raphanus sativus]